MLGDPRKRKNNRRRGPPTPELAHQGKSTLFVPVTTTTPNTGYHGDGMGGRLEMLPHLLIKEPEKILECLQPPLPSSTPGR